MAPPPVLVVTDVFGATPEVQRLARAIAGERAVVVDPYGGRDPGFTDDAAAYRHFQAEDGPRRLEALVRGLVTPDTRLIGFSAGAAAAWRVLAEAPAGGAVLFYGSRIRDALDLVPQCPVEVVLPTHEDHVDVGALGAALEAVARVTVTRTPWRHGFLNPRSTGWDAGAAADWTRRLAAWAAGGVAG